MANIQSQKKRIESNAKRHAINKSYKSEVKTSRNKTLQAISNNDEQSLSLVNDYYSLVDKGVKKGIFHKNKAANKKAKMMNKFNIAAKN